MSDVEVFMVDAEITMLPESEIYMKGSGIAFVYCFIPAVSVEDALSKLKREFRRMNCKIIRVQSVYPYAGTEWEKKKQQKEFDGYAKEAGESNQIVFSPFLTY